MNEISPQEEQVGQAQKKRRSNHFGVLVPSQEGNTGKCRTRSDTTGGPIVLRGINCGFWKSWKVRMTSDRWAAHGLSHEVIGTSPCLHSPNVGGALSQRTVDRWSPNRYDRLIPGRPRSVLRKTLPVRCSCQSFLLGCATSKCHGLRTAHTEGKLYPQGKQHRRQTT